MEPTVICTVCNSQNLKTVLDFGKQPPANRFLSDSNALQETFSLALGYCADCGMIQLTQRIPFDAIRPRFDWLLYNEPEGHLDDVALELKKLPGITDASRILGITYKDQSTLNRLLKLGMNHGQCIDEINFDIPEIFFGLETIQQVLRNSKTVTQLKNQYGAADVLIMRHVIEHSDNAKELMLSLKELIADNGYVVIELPDSSKIFSSCNHAFVWEEHISYFTEETLKLLAEEVGAEIAWFKRYSYPYEDSLLAAFRFNALPKKNNQSEADISETENTLLKFRTSFDDFKIQWRKTLEKYIHQGEKVAVFGAGHLSGKFINFFELHDLIDCVIDDHPKKSGMNMPGSLLPIRPSSALSQYNIKVCISTLSPESELKVRNKMTSYFDQGGSFVSAFAGKQNFYG